jgi:hypothetical protein
MSRDLDQTNHGRCRRMTRSKPITPLPAAGFGAERYLATSGLFHSSNGGASFDPLPLPGSTGNTAWRWRA